MLRKFKISIDGKEYLVEMEEIGGKSVATNSVVSIIPETIQSTETIPQQQPTVSQQQATPVVDDNEAMTAPMPGTILRILVGPGETVAENQPLMILEAMKMENEVVANRSGVIGAIHVTQGQMVNPGDALVTIV
ncbi:acetyl-CoA carboxylase biotin carboxyl carrier protein subunit [Enterococcus cecorum]|uniref:acetyl-CoA carboxylase biotin carboxyl carrier protein subunit n=1 Tax=Enterococcus cecorum TaxID=44008 RepID=UPI0025A454D5|nr:acetyl-CoA carboxylase biotin carboxyl carrier protein subunit [Enterococcus cecorum]MDM8183636.1 acetyl-CoA carboxylase biotin carboxyl carrier protein subunit [Enterococcus cecorum]